MVRTLGKRIGGLGGSISKRAFFLFMVVVLGVGMLPPALLRLTSEPVKAADESQYLQQDLDLLGNPYPKTSRWTYREYEAAPGSEKELPYMLPRMYESDDSIAYRTDANHDGIDNDGDSGLTNVSFGRGTGYLQWSMQHASGTEWDAVGKRTKL